MSGTAATIEDLVAAAARAVVRHAADLTALDQAIGDGDHGTNMKRGAEAVLAELPALSGRPPREVLKAVGTQLVMKVGGASGPIYGTLVLELGKVLPANPGRPDIVAALDAAIAGVKARGKSDAGQKTLIDVLVPVRAALAGGSDPAGIAAAAGAAAEATAPLQARKGRASFLGERSVGHVDPGARSCAIAIGAVCAELGR